MDDLEHVLGMSREVEAILRASRDDERRSQRKWDEDFLALAEFYASRKSKDPSTRVGAVITKGREVVSLGYNGFARGVADLPERYADRDVKLALVVHAERNAMIFARRDLAGCTLYTWPFMPCPSCAGEAINAGIVRVVAPVCPPDKAERWAKLFEWSQLQFEEAGVELVLL